MLPLRQPREHGLTRVRLYVNDKPYRSKKPNQITHYSRHCRVNKLYSTGRGYCPLLGAYRIKLLTLELLEKTMGLEKVVLNKIEEVNADIADNAYFAYGTLFIKNADQFKALDVYRMMQALKSVVLCELQLSEAGNEFAIDFI
jgi:hypothetical protein